MIYCLVKGKHITVCLRGIFLQLAPKKLYYEIDRRWPWWVILLRLPIYTQMAHNSYLNAMYYLYMVFNLGLLSLKKCCASRSVWAVIKFGEPLEH